jgi:(4S)-4-hydroxy-5-phosphonooxypentane-2,3-dione isomerase
MFIVTVDFRIKPEHRHNFLQQMTANAKASIANESGCNQFDVCVSAQDPCHIFLYEVYQSSADFDLHLKTAHFLAFNAATLDYIENKTVRSFNLAS